MNRIEANGTEPWAGRRCWTWTRRMRSTLTWSSGRRLRARLSFATRGAAPSSSRSVRVWHASRRLVPPARIGERRPRAAPPDAWVTPAVPAAGAARRTIRCVQRHSPLSAPSPGCDRHRLLAAARNLAPCTGARASDVWRRPSWTTAARALGR